MNSQGPIRRVQCAVLLLLLSATASGQIASALSPKFDPTRNRRDATKFRQALAAGDIETQIAIARTETSFRDPFLIAHELLLDGFGSEGPGEAGDPSLAATTLAGYAQAWDCNRPLLPLVERWKGSSGKARGRWQRLDREARQLRKLNDSGQFAQVIEATGDAEPPVEGIYVIAATLIERERARALRGLERFDAAREASERVAAIARRIGWSSMQVEALAWAAYALVRQARHEEALVVLGRITEMPRSTRAYPPLPIVVAWFCRVGAARAEARRWLATTVRGDGGTLELPNDEVCDPFLFAEALLRREYANEPGARAAVDRLLALTDGEGRARAVRIAIEKARKPSQDAQEIFRDLASHEEGIASGLGVETWAELATRTAAALKRVGEQEGPRPTVARLHAQLAILQFACGKDTNARDALRDAAARAEAIGWTPMRLATLRLAAIVDFLIDRPRYHERCATILEVAESAELATADARADLGEALLTLGRTRDARPHLAEATRMLTAAEPSARALQLVDGLVVGRATTPSRPLLSMALRNLAYCLIHARRHEAAIRALERARTIAEDDGDRLALPRLVYTLAICHGAIGQRDRAASLRREAHALAVEVGDLAQQAVFASAAGDLAARRRRYEEARSHFATARDLYARVGERARLVSVKSKLGRCEVELDRPEAALELLTGARDELVAIKNRYEAAIALGNLGTAYAKLGEFDRAIEHLETAEGELRALGNRRRADLTRRRLAEACYDAGLLEKAIDLFATLAEGRSDAAIRARRYIGLSLANLERYAEGIGILERAIDEAKARGQSGSAAVILNNLGGVLINTGQLGRAWDCYQEVLSMRHGEPWRHVPGWAHIGLARILGHRGDLDAALDHCQRSKRIFEAAKDRGGNREALRVLARLLLARGEHEDALSRFSECRELSLRAGRRGHAAVRLLDIGTVLAAMGRSSEALDTYEQALSEARECGEGYAHLRFLALGGIAAMHAKEGRNEEAVRRIRECLAIRAPFGVGYAEEEAFELNEDLRDVADVGLVALSQRVAEDAQANVAETAFALIETSRAIVLAERLGARETLLRRQLSPELHQRYRLARAKVKVLSARLATHADDERDPERERRIRVRLSAAYDALERVNADIERTAAGTASLTRPNTPSLSRFRATLSENRVFVHYVITRAGSWIDARAFALATTRDTSSLIDLGPAKPIREAVDAYMELLANTGGTARQKLERRLATRLYERLVRPIEAVRGRRSSLVISPEGELAFLPFGALIHEVEGKSARLIEECSISYQPSATVFTALLDTAAERPSGSGFLGLGDPVYTVDSKQEPPPFDPSVEARGGRPLARLPHSGTEVQRVGDFFEADERTVLLRDRASIAGLRKALDAVDGHLACIHIACHGHVDTRRPRLTGLFLSGPELLPLQELYEMRLPADLAVLSACGTNRGAIRRGEGVVGLVRGFFFGGAPRVVVTNWRVDDKSTSALMVSFYRHMLEKGHSAAAALRAAQIEMLRTDGDDSDPHHWAPFVLWGLD